MEKIFDQYRSLIEYSNQSDFDPKQFNVMINNYTYQYKKLDYSQQGLLAELINSFYENQ